MYSDQHDRNSEAPRARRPKSVHSGVRRQVALSPDLDTKLLQLAQRDDLSPSTCMRRLLSRAIALEMAQTEQMLRALMPGRSSLGGAAGLEARR